MQPTGEMQETPSMCVEKRQNYWISLLRVKQTRVMDASGWEASKGHQARLQRNAAHTSTQSTMGPMETWPGHRGGFKPELDSRPHSILPGTLGTVYTCAKVSPNAAIQRGWYSFCTSVKATQGPGRGGSGAAFSLGLTTPIALESHLLTPRLSWALRILIASHLQPTISGQPASHLHTSTSSIPKAPITTLLRLDPQLSLFSIPLEPKPLTLQPAQETGRFGRAAHTHMSSPWLSAHGIYKVQPQQPSPGYTDGRGSAPRR